MNNGSVQRLLRLGFALGLLCLASVTGAHAQGPLPDWLSVEERARIEKEKGEKDRAEAILKVSQLHLEIARNNVVAEQYEQASNEIKKYGTLVEYMFAFVNGSPSKEKEKKKIFKMVELKLRTDLNQLESLRFQLPERYANEASDVYDRVRKAREQALGMVFGKEFFPANTPDEKTQ